MTNQANQAPPILLTIAGFDPSCGAGVAADLKTFAAHNCYGIAAVTAITVQSTLGVRAVHATPHATLRAQLECLADDVTLAGVKIGMLANRANASVVADFLDAHKLVHVVLDPVTRATSGEPAPSSSRADTLKGRPTCFARGPRSKSSAATTSRVLTLMDRVAPFLPPSSPN